MFSETQHENMYLNVISNFIAIILGCFAAIIHDKVTPPHNLLALLTPDSLTFLLHSIVGGCIAFMVKVSGDLFLMWLKKPNKKYWFKKSKGGNND